MTLYYRVFQPDHKRKGQWKKTHSPLFRAIFRRNPDLWQPWTPGKRLTWSDDAESPIKNSFQTTTTITTKSFLAGSMNKLGLMGKCYPETIIINNSVPTFLNKETRALFDANVPGQYYLKPDKGYAGQGIKILSRPQEFRKLGKLQQYVLQRGVTDLLLYNDKLKFEFRVWIAFVWTDSGSDSKRIGTIRTGPGRKDHIKVYYYNDVVMRLSTRPFDPHSLKTLGNVATSAHYYKDTGYKSDLLSKQPYFERVFPKSVQICEKVVRELSKSIKTNGKQGFEIMGFDFLIKSDETPILIEINRNIGYYTWPKEAHAPCVVECNMKMIRDIIDIAILANHESENKFNELI